MVRLLSSATSLLGDDSLAPQPTLVSNKMIERIFSDYCRHGRPEIKKNSISGEKWLRCKCSEGYFGHQ